MYKDYYQLSAEPFRLTPTPGFAYAHTSYREARHTMQHALEQRAGLLVVTGYPGTGKTTLVQGFVAGIKTNVFVGTLLSSSLLEAEDLLTRAAHAFGLDAPGMDRDTLLRDLEKRLKRYSGALLIIDEAQNLGSSALEEVRKLAQGRAGSRPLLQIFMLGQPQLHENLQQPGMEPVLQSVMAQCTLAPLSLQETHDYVQHRLDCAGWTENPVITTETFILIHRFSRGLPRHINAMCTRLFLHGAVEEKNQLDLDDFVTVIELLEDENLLPAVPPMQPGSCTHLPSIRELIRTTALPLGKRLELSGQEQAFIAGHPAHTRPVPVPVPVNLPPPVTIVSAPTPANNMALPKGSAPANSAKGRYLGYGAAALVLAAGGYLLATPNTELQPSPVRSEPIASPAKPDPARTMPAPDQVAVTEAIAPPVKPDPVQSMLAGYQGIVAEAIAPAVKQGPVQVMPASNLIVVTEAIFPPARPDPVRTMPAGNQGIATQAVPAASAPDNGDSGDTESAQLAALQDARNEEIEQLLMLAQQAIARDYLRLSTKESAWSYYQQVLELDPDNNAVGEGLKRIATRYGELTRAQIYAQRYDKAQLFITRGLSVVPDDNRLLALREEVDAAQAELFAQQEAERLLALEAENRPEPAEAKGLLAGIKRFFSRSNKPP